MVIASVPTASADVVRVALPLPFSVPVPRTLAPFMKGAVPVGGPAAGATADTGAVKVTDWPKTDGLTKEASDVLLDAVVTVCLRIGEVLPVKFVSPAYETVIGWTATASVEVVNVALP